MTHDPEPILWLSVLAGVAGAIMLLWTPLRRAYTWVAGICWVLYHARKGRYIL